MRALWLIRRVAWGGPSSVAPAVLLGVGMAAIVFLGLCSVSAEQVMTRQHDRETANTILVDAETARVVRGDLGVIAPVETNSRRWNGHEIRREYYAAGDSDLVAPGVPAMPRPGEFYASPDLIALLSTDPVVAALFEPYRLVGRIGPAGLVQPHELRAILGVGPDRNGLIKVEGFGGTPAGYQAFLVNGGNQPNVALNRSVTAYVLALVWIPAAFFVLIIARLAASRRRRRVTALHLIGCPRRRIRLLHLIEAACVCVPSAVLGCLAHWVATQHVSRVPGTSFGFFPADARLPLLAYLIVGAVGSLVVCLVVSGDRQTFERRRRARSRQRRRLRLGMSRLGVHALATGLLLLILPPVFSLEGAVVPLAMWTGLVLSGIGIAVAGPSVVMRALAGRVRQARATSLVGRRLASDRVTTTMRLASVMSVVIVLLLGSQSFATVLKGGSAEDWARRAERQGQVPLQVRNSGGLTLEAVDGVADARGVTELRQIKTTDGRLNVVFSSCARLAVLTGRPDTTDCSRGTGPHWLVRAPSHASNTPEETTLPSGGTIVLPAATTTLDLPGLPEAFTGALLLPVDRARTTRDPDGGDFYLIAPADEVNRVIASISALNPRAQIDLGTLDRQNPDTQQYPNQIEWLGVGAVLGLVIGFLSLLVVSLDEAQERSPRMRALRILGASRWQLLIAHLWSTAIPLVMVGGIAVVVGRLTTQGMRNIDDRAGVDPGLYALVTGAVVLGGVLVFLATWPAVTRPSRRAGSFSA